ncbi:hypothetical protein ACSVDA_21420 [Cytobacillus sp. Hm23]
MCQLCNGTHRIHQVDNCSVEFSVCPECGPEPKSKQEERMKRLRQRIQEAEIRFGVTQVIAS